MSRAPATPAIAILTRRVAWGLVEVLVVVMLVLVDGVDGVSAPCVVMAVEVVEMDGCHS